MARHVAEGGKPYDDFGNHITGLSEELAKLRKFKNYMSRSSVMAESLSEYMDVVVERINGVKDELARIQKQTQYAEAFESFENVVLEDVPEDVAEAWVDQLTIRQFNEELKDIFPYIYRLVSEARKASELGPEDLVDESGLQYYTGKKKYGKDGMAALAKAGRDGASEEELGAIKDKYKKTKEEFELEHAFEDAMGQFSDHVCEECGNPSWRTLPEEKQKGVDGKVCWKGYKRMGTKMKGGKRVDNCVKVGEGEEEDIPASVEAEIEKFLATNPKNGDALQALHHKAIDDKNKELDDYLTFLYDYVADQTGAGGTEELGVYDEMLDMLTQMMNDKGWSEGDDDTMDVKINSKGQMMKADAKEKKIPVTEFILSMYDRETGQFPKGETAVLTAVEKDYGENFIEPAKQFIEAIHSKFEEFQMRENPQEMEPQVDFGFDRMKELAGLR
jgi:hypothetical protein